MTRVLLISDDPGRTSATQLALRGEGIALRAETSVDRGLVTAREWQPLVLMVDLGIGLGVGGLATLLRDGQVRDAMAVLAVAEPTQFGLVGPGTGVDDVIVPPLDGDELRLRVTRLLAAAGVESESGLLRRGELEIDQERYTVRLEDEAVDLTYKEYELLRFLAMNPGKAFTREQLLNQVWGYDYYGGSRTVDVHVRRIRSKIERRQPYIETVRNVGYRFVELSGR